MTFRSKVDGWVATSLFVGGALQVVVLAILALFAPGALLVALPILLLVVAFVAWLYFATRYVVTHDRLFIRGGVVNIDVPLNQITGIEPTSNPLSAPAWSLDRLLISYGHGRSCMISPKDKDRFLALLRERGVRVA